MDSKAVVAGNLLGRWCRRKEQCTWRTKYGCPPYWVRDGRDTWDNRDRCLVVHPAFGSKGVPADKVFEEELPPVTYWDWAVCPFLAEWDGQDWF